MLLSTGAASRISTFASCSTNLHKLSTCHTKMSLWSCQPDAAAGHPAHWWLLLGQRPGSEARRCLCCFKWGLNLGSPRLHPAARTAMNIKHITVCCLMRKRPVIHVTSCSTPTNRHELILLKRSLIQGGVLTAWFPKARATAMCIYAQILHRYRHWYLYSENIQAPSTVYCFHTLRSVIRLR